MTCTKCAEAIATLTAMREHCGFVTGIYDAGLTDEDIAAMELPELQVEYAIMRDAYNELRGMLEPQGESDG